MLLDSAGKSVENQTLGQNVLKATSTPCVPSQWFALRVTYSRELKYQTQLNDVGVKTFVPMVRKLVEKAGKKKIVLVPAVNNLLFACSTQQELYEFMTGLGESRPVAFIWDKSTRLPIVVPDKAMEDFIRVSSESDQDIVFLGDLSNMKTGATVRVTDGIFKGVEGKVVRVRKSRRVMVEVAGILAVATAFIPPAQLELI